jgi:hypothetical protein
MKLTRKRLGRLIESVLNEMPARQPSGLDPSFYWTVQRFPVNEFEEEWDDIAEVFRQRKFIETVHITGNMILPKWGDTEIAHLQMKKFEGCPHWEIKNVGVRGDRFYKNHKIKQPETAKDLGPMLYDIAMEIAGEDGLISDSTGSSGDAQRVWNFYLNNRAGVDIDVVNIAPGTCGRPGNFPAMTFQFKAYRKKPGSPSIIQSLGNKIRIA